jgi:PAS domain S-box-containing protein
MSSRQQRIQTLYEISLSIGPKETLTATAEAALSGYLQKLNCSVGGVYRRQDDGEYDPVTTVPVDPSADGLLTAATDRLPVVHSTDGLSDALPVAAEIDTGECCYLFELPEFGVLILGKHSGELDRVTRSALTEVNERLAEACQSLLTERQLRKERNRFQAVFDAIPEPVARTVVEDGTEYIKACNKPFRQTFGLPEQTPGKGLLDELSPETAGWDQRSADADPAGRYVTTETTCPTRNGTSEFLFHSVPVESDHEAEYIQLYVDISDQKQRERELERYERLVENLPIGVFQTTPGPDGEFRLVNRGLVDILEADSKNYFDDIAPSDLYVNPERRAEFSERLLTERAVEGVELQFETAAGNPIWVEVSGIVAEANGETVFELAMQDISARKERDQQLSVLNRVLRHNLRNAINVIEGNAALLGDAVDEDHLQASVEGIERRVKNLKQLSEKAVTVRSVFDKGRRIDTVCDVSELLDAVATEFEGRHAEASFTVGEFESLYVRADIRLKLALNELVSNAIVHNDHANPSVTMTATPAKENRDEEWVDIVIADNGPGIPSQERVTIETGDETPLQHGTGLGLWLVYWAISLLGGDVRIDQSSSGTRVTLTLPRADADGGSDALDVTQGEDSGLDGELDHGDVTDDSREPDGGRDTDSASTDTAGSDQDVDGSEATVHSPEE